MANDGFSPKLVGFLCRWCSYQALFLWVVFPHSASFFAVLARHFVIKVITDDYLRVAKASFAFGTNLLFGNFSMREEKYFLLSAFMPNFCKVAA